MKVSCSKGATATLNNNIINLSNVVGSQTCTVSIPEITADNYPYLLLSQVEDMTLQLLINSQVHLME